MRDAHARQQEGRARLPIAEARANRTPLDWQAPVVSAPLRPGLSVFDDYDLAELVRYIDWKPFFQAWELAGSFPTILDDAVVGASARSLYADAQAMLQRIIGEKWLRARAVVGLWPANAVGDDIEVYTDESRTQVLETLHSLRQQMAREPGRERAHHALADYIAPKQSGVADWIGGFAVTTGIGLDERARAFEAAHDDYNAILLKALGDRLAEALAERMHERVRTELWGYAAGEALTPEELIAEKFQGIRPAPGYPACPDHTEKATLWRLLDAERTTGITLTDSYAMLPTAAVSGLYFAHPQARYFGLGKIERDQVADYAARKGMDIATMERWLAPNLNYEPGA